jgi:hypothetical protein
MKDPDESLWGLKKNLENKKKEGKGGKEWESKTTTSKKLKNYTRKR